MHGALSEPSAGIARSSYSSYFVSLATRPKSSFLIASHSHIHDTVANRSAAFDILGWMGLRTQIVAHQLWHLSTSNEKLRPITPTNPKLSDARHLAFRSRSHPAAYALSPELLERLFRTSSLAQVSGFCLVLAPPRGAWLRELRSRRRRHKKTDLAPTPSLSARLLC